jgi:DNA-binding transcriptional regulator PaaX
MTHSTDTPRPTKTTMLRDLLTRRAGASITQLCEATGWQKHSVRAALSGFRKAGHTIERRAPAKPGGEARYRITGKPGGA